MVGAGAGKLEPDNILPEPEIKNGLEPEPEIKIGLEPEPKPEIVSGARAGAGEKLLQLRKKLQKSI